MDAFNTAVSKTLDSVVSAAQMPVIILLLLLAIFIIVALGSLIGEYYREHRDVSVFLPRLVEELRQTQAGTGEDTCDVIKASGLLLRQKQYLMELTRHPQASSEMRESLAAGLEFKENSRYESIVKVTDIASKIAPMLGLLGTLIPLGPGLSALNSGDTATLAAALTTAFNTTSLGLMIAAIALIISAIRKRWYKAYMSDFDTAMECVLDIEANRQREN